MGLTRNAPRRPRGDALLRIFFRRLDNYDDLEVRLAVPCSSHYCAEVAVTDGAARADRIRRRGGAVGRGGVESNDAWSLVVSRLCAAALSIEQMVDEVVLSGVFRGEVDCDSRADFDEL